MARLPENIRIAVGADHAGYRAKERIKKVLTESGIAVEDLGTHSEESVDYPDFARAVAEQVARGQARFGILVCGTGMGMGMAANKIPGIRAAVAHDRQTAHLAREHNDANVLAVGARVVDEGTLLEIVQEFLSTEFAGERHQRRVNKVNELDKVRLTGKP